MGNKGLIQGFRHKPPRCRNDGKKHDLSKGRGQESKHSFKSKRSGGRKPARTQRDGSFQPPD